ncbi:MAG: pyrroline-5-carboxylate reductase [Bdellovibrio sp.]|nr:MAG: pyrroline-5-carboxylate reductase [Bdellovibrio sp.]
MQRILDQKKIGFIGAGNMTQTVVGALIEAKKVKPSQIWVTNRTERKLQKMKSDYGVHILKNNEELIDTCDIVFIAVKPQEIYACLEPIASSFEPHHIVVSFAAGVTLSALQKLIPQTHQLVRVIPNTPASLQQAVVGYAVTKGNESLGDLIEELFEAMGVVVKIEEGEALEALTVACSSGVGFIFELMMYWQEWLEEHGFSPEKAKELTIQTFLGASLLAQKSTLPTLTDLQNKVVSSKGVTAAGLASMRELEIERLLRYSFEKAALRDKELGAEA